MRKNNDTRLRNRFFKQLQNVADRQTSRIADDLEARLVEDLPDARVHRIKRHGHLTLEVMAHNLKARELGSLSEVSDQPLSRIIDRLRS